jgi:RecA-family ATPase
VFISGTVLALKGGSTVDEDEDPQLKQLVDKFRREHEVARSQYPGMVVICPIVVVTGDSISAESVAQAIEQFLRGPNN